MYVGDGDPGRQAAKGSVRPPSLRSARNAENMYAPSSPLPSSTHCLAAPPSSTAKAPCIVIREVLQPSVLDFDFIVT